MLHSIQCFIQFNGIENVKDVQRHIEIGFLGGLKLIFNEKKPFYPSISLSLLCFFSADSLIGQFKSLSISQNAIKKFRDLFW